jgi:DNA-binding GntR family transcriptional regulator
MTKHEAIIRLLKRRIAEGDYALGELPGEHSLAAELGVGRMTVRRAVVAMIEEGVLTRAASRRLVVNTAADHPAVREIVGFLAPAFTSPSSERTRHLLEHVAARIEAWRTWCEAAGVSGALYDEPVASFEQPIAAAVALVKRLLVRDRLNAPELLVGDSTGPVPHGTGA